MNGRFWTALATLGGVAVPVVAVAVTLHVPADYPSVLAAVDAAVAGDSVLVGPGTWTDREVRTIPVGGSLLHVASVAFLKPGLTLIGTAGPGATILDGGADTTAIVATLEHYLSGSAVTRVEGITITGSGDGVGAIEASPLELRDCWLVRNGELAVVSRGQNIGLRECIVSENVFDHSLAGAIDGIDVDVSCIGCTFERNAWAAIYLRGSTNSLVMRDCLVGDHAGGRGVRFRYGTVEIEGCTFVRNSVGATGGAVNLYDATGSVRFSVFAFDSSGSGALTVALSSVRVENNTFYGCHGSIEGGAIFVDGNDAGVLNNVIVRSTGQRGAVSKVGGPTHPDTGCNLLWDNAGGDYFGDWVPAPTDIHADPEFCDEAAGDYSLSSTSPAAPANSPVCGLIGALDVQCGPVSVGTESWGRIKSRYRGARREIDP